MIEIMYHKITGDTMWPKSYRDYPVDKPLIKYQVEPGRGIIGCEMHEINGWGNSYHNAHKHYRRRRDSTLFSKQDDAF